MFRLQHVCVTSCFSKALAYVRMLNSNNYLAYIVRVSEAFCSLQILVRAHIYNVEVHTNHAKVCGGFSLA